MPVHVLYQDARCKVMFGREAEEYALSLQFENAARGRLSFGGVSLIRLQAGEFIQ